MKLNITARHLDLTPALSDTVHRKVEKAQRYFNSIIWAQAILTVEKHRHIAELVVHTPGATFRTKGEAGDLYSAIDLAAHKLDLHLMRIKDKKIQHRTKISSRNFELAKNPESKKKRGDFPLPLFKGIIPNAHFGLMIHIRNGAKSDDNECWK